MAQAIGDMAGRVWGYLLEKGPATASRMARELECPRDHVQRAIGWLARENKLAFEQDNGSERVSLK